nr:EOG090X0IV9 [Cyclestheria hislopi]
MADKLGLGSEVKELRLGSSFTNKGSAFHTFRYDFKPASVDTSKMATVDILPNNEVTVTVPHCDGAGTAQTSVFRGPKKPYTKECVLIIDHSTGEITLERLSHNIQLKKTRAEGSSKAARPVSPVETLQQPPNFTQLKKPSPLRKSPPTSSSSPAAPSPPYRSPVEVPVQKPSPKHSSSIGPGRRKGGSPNTIPFNNAAMAPSLPGSMPLIGDIDESPSVQQEEAADLVGLLSDSSSDSGSDSSSVSSGSESDSDMDSTPIPTAPANGRSGNTIARETTTSSNPQFNHLSMPSHLLSEDLQLSESGSDSD